MITEKQKKEMLLNIINEKIKYECRSVKQSIDNMGNTTFEFGDWIPYNLGDAIYDEWDYRIVNPWLNNLCKERMIYERENLGFESEEIYNSTKFGANQICKKILEDALYKEHISISELFEIMQNLGVTDINTSNYEEN